MLTIKEAVGTAVNKFGDLFPDEAKDVRLEEIDHAEGDNAWKITISIANPDFDKELEAQRQLTHSVFGISRGVGDAVRTRRL